MEQFKKMLELCNEYETLTEDSVIDVPEGIMIAYLECGELAARELVWLDFSSSYISFLCRGIGGACLREEGTNGLFANFGKIIEMLEKIINDIKNS